MICVNLCLNSHFRRTKRCATQPTSGRAVTVDTNCCANCVETSRPSKGGRIYCILGKPVMQTRLMAGAAPHKNGSPVEAGPSHWRRVELLHFPYPCMS